MKALVTGASGFLGSHLVDRLIERRDSVRALVRPTSDTAYLRERGADLFVGDVAEPDSLAAAVMGVDVVYHAAAMVSDWAPWRDFRLATIDGTRNVLAAAAAAGVPRFLYVSTDGVYAMSSFGRRVTEESPLERRFGWWDYYRRAKLAAEMIARDYLEEDRIALSIVRPGLLLGERDRVALPGIVTFLRGSTAAYLGDGHNRLPCVYAGDVAEACILAAASEKAVRQTYNIASDETVTQRELFQAVAEASGLRPPRRTLPLALARALAFSMELWSVASGRRARPSVTRFAVNLMALDYEEDVSKARRELGWEAKVSMREAVRRSVEWDQARQPRLAGR